MEGFKASPANLLPAGSTSTGSWIPWQGGKGIFRAWGTWGGAVATLQHAADSSGAGAANVGINTTLNGDGGGGFSLDACYIRVSISGATGTTSLSASAGEV